MKAEVTCAVDSEVAVLERMITGEEFSSEVDRVAQLINTMNIASHSAPIKQIVLFMSFMGCNLL